MDERVSFTRPSAERIARVVRAVEGARTPADGIQSRRPPTDAKMPKLFRVATYTGAWSIGALKTVVFKNQTATPNTATVLNLFYPVTSTAAGSRDCGIAKEGTAWYLIDVRMATATAVFAGATQSVSVLGTASTSSITVINTAETSTITFASIGGSQSILTSVAASLNTANCSITITNTTATIAVAGATQTATIVSNLSTQKVTVVSMASTQNITVVSSTYTAAYLRLE